MESHIKLLRDYLQGEKPFAKFEPLLRDQFLANFILGKKRDLDNAKKSLKNYLQMRTQLYPQILLSTVPIRHRLFDLKHYSVLSNLDKDGNLIGVFRMSKWDTLPEVQETADEWFRELTGFADALMHTRTTQCETGMVVIFDCRAVEYKHIRIMTLPLLIQSLKVGLAYPVRVKTVHYILDSFVIKTILMLLTPFIPRTIAGRIKSHNSPESLLEFIDASILPKELGGEVEDDSCYDQEIIRKTREMESYFSEFAKTLEADHSTAESKKEILNK